MTGMNDLAALVMAVLVSVFPRMVHRDRAASNVGVILRACEREHVSTRVCLWTVGECFTESGLQTRHARASLCGCQPYGTDNVTQATCAVRSARRAFAVCGGGDPFAASRRYVDGRCDVPAINPARQTPGAVRWLMHVDEHVYQSSRSWLALWARVSP